MKAADEHEMNCDRAIAAMHARIDGDLNERDATALDGHLAWCEDCREFEAGLPFVLSAVRDLPTVALPDDALDAVFAATTRRQSAPLVYRLITRWQTAAVAAVLAFALFLGFMPTPRRTAPAASPEAERAYAEAQFVVQLTGRVLNDVQQTTLDEIGEIRTTPAVQRISGLWSIPTNDMQH